MNNTYNGGVTVPPNTPTVIGSVAVPAGVLIYNFTGFIISSPSDITVTVKKNVDTIFSGYCTGATPLLHIDFSSSPYGLMGGDQIIILGTQLSDDDHIVYCTLLAEQQ